MGLIAVSCGDPAGVGPDIALTAWSMRAAHPIPPFRLIGDPEQLAARARALNLTVAIREPDTGRADGGFSDWLPVARLENRFDHDQPGKPDARFAPGIIEAIDRAVADTMTGAADATVTCPIAKDVLYQAGFAHPGHTEYLAALALRHGAGSVHPVMMIAGPQLRTVPVTIHIPLADVPGALTSELIVRTARITAHDLGARFGMARPRLAISGLNPHAGENGALGAEDDAIIRPAIETLLGDGLDIVGPLPADTMFHEEARRGYDVAICMYHDQALIPAKALGFDDAVNVTLGLPFIRTSPDHGTAFGIAGSGAARPTSFIAALRMARAMADARA